MTKTVSDLQFESKNNWLLRFDSLSSAGITYIGKATIGTATSAPAWQISKLDETTDLDLLWADEGRFTQVWDDRLSLTYS